MALQPSASTEVVEKSTKRDMMPPPISEIEPGLFIGNSWCSYHQPSLQNNHITAIVSLVNAPHGRWGSPTVRNIVPKDRHLWIECVDSSTQNMLIHMTKICDFIDQMFLPWQAPSSSLSQQNLETRVPPSGSMETAQAPQVEEVVEVTGPQASGGVLVHCQHGISRSATVVVAYLMRKHRAKLENVLAAVRAKRKVKPSPNFMAQLEVWDEVGYQIWEDVEKKIPKKPYLAYTERRAADLKAKGLTGNEPIRPLNL